MGGKIAYESRRGGDSNIYLMDTNGRNVVKLTRTPPGIDNKDPYWLTLGAFAVNPNGKLPISWGVLKRSRKPRDDVNGARRQGRVIENIASAEGVAYTLRWILLRFLFQ